MPRFQAPPTGPLAPVSARAAMILLSLWLPGCSGDRSPPEPSSEASGSGTHGRVIDHHVHILSPQLVADWKSLGVPFSRPDSAYTSAAALLDREAGREALEGAVLVPMAHLYGNEEFREALGLTLEAEQDRVRHENDHVAAEGARFPGRALSLCSIPLGRPYTRDELSRCVDDHPRAGVKVHLAASGVDLRDDSDLREIAEVARWCRDRNRLLLLHFDPQRRGLATADVRRLIDVVLQPLPDLEVVVAHLGGSGGYGPWTRSVLAEFTSWLDAESARGERRTGVRFDVSAVFLAEETEGVPATTDEEAAWLRADLGALDPARLVFGSDYPVFDPFTAFELLVERGGLDPERVAGIAENRTPSAPPGS